MKIYDAILFWLGGVLAETVADLTLQHLPPEADAHQGLALGRAVRDLAEQLALGKISSSEYCRRVGALRKGGPEASALQEGILASASLRRPVLGLIERIPASVERWLVVDFPGDWWQPLSARWRLDSLFPESRTILTCDLKLSRMAPDVFYHLPSRAGRSRDECITVDALSTRAVASMRHGLASVIYVYPERLRLELALQAIYPTAADIMHPTSSERVQI